MNKNVLSLTLRIYLGLFVISSLVLWFIYSVTYKAEINTVKEREINELSGHNNLVRRIIDSLTSDVLFLSQLPDLRLDFNPDYISQTFLKFSSSKKIYDQVRFIDVNGHEQIRVNWNNASPHIVEKNLLQNKKGRYYFDDTFKLEDNQVFISPLDLNIERNKIEEPLKPMLRIGAPVFNSEGKKIGIILLNYLAKDLIDELKKNIISKHSKLYFLNQDGYWLYSDKKEDEWGFMYADKANQVFKNRFSEKLWDEIYNNNEGQIQNEFGVFSFNTIYPLNLQHFSSTGSGKAFEASKADIEWKKYKWKLISYISKEDLKKITSQTDNNYLILWTLSLIINFIISLIMAKTIVLRQKADADRLSAEKRYRILFEQAGESIVVTQKDKTIMANRRTLNFFEYAHDELLTMPLPALIHQDDRDKLVQNKIKQFDESIESLVFEARIISKTGKEKWAEIRSTRLELQDEIALLYFFLDVSERKKMEARLKELATIDSLTNCYNRGYFSELLIKEIERAHRTEQKLTFIMIDIDHFKKINDTFGHAIGDLVLKKFVEITKCEIRTIDIIGRLGGEEFGVVLPNCTLKNGMNCAERIRLALQECDLKSENMNKDICFTISLGVTELNKFDDIDSLLKRADNALYAAKDEGRNRVVSI